LKLNFKGVVVRFKLLRVQFCAKTFYVASSSLDFSKVVVIGGEARHHFTGEDYLSNIEVIDLEGGTSS